MGHSRAVQINSAGGLHELHPEDQERILKLQLTVLESVAAGEPSQDVLDHLCSLVEQLVPRSVASIMVMDEASQTLRVFAAPSLSAEAVQRLNGLRPGPGSGSCGNAVYRQEPAFVANTNKDPRWADIRQFATDFKICACWSHPVRAGGQQVIGSFALSSFEERAPGRFHTRVMEVCAHIAGIVLDQRRQAESRRLADLVLSNLDEGVVVTDPATRIVSVNPAFCRVTGYTPDEVLGQTPAILASGRHEENFYHDMWADLKAQGHWQGEIWNRRKSGEVYPEWLSITQVQDDGGRLIHYVAIFSDITEHKAAEARIAFLASHDTLTGLPNRSLAADRIEVAIGHARRDGRQVAVLFIDLDNFKLINDSLGHAAGDNLLEQIAQRLRNCVRETDTVSRHGGDEFIILLPDMEDGASAAGIAEKILYSMDAPFIVDGLEVSTTLSMGIATYPEDGADFATLVQRADKAMFHAKEAGRNAYQFYTPHMQVEGTERLQMRHSLRQALERQEFCLHYQPQIDLASGRIVGVEALIRWQHPELGMVPPDRFIPLAEVSGLIVPMGEWVLREACHQAAAWREDGLPPMAMSVNLSGVQFRRGNLEASIRCALRETKLDPSLLTLEITESILMKDSEGSHGLLQQLKALGIHLAIDDFGTGYSSLAYLRRFAVDSIKIDRSFVHELGTDPDATAIVEAILQMARSLKLKVVAEGVEDATVSGLLREAGCETGQGYHYGRPMPAERFAQYAQDWERAGLSI